MVRSLMPITPIGKAAVGLLVFYWLWQVIGLLWPTSFWYTVDRVEVLQPAYEGQKITLSVVREVKRPFDGEYEVIIEPLESREIVCDGSASLRYDPDRNLPTPVTLDWWVGDPCPLPAGDYHMITEWEIKGTVFEAFDKDVRWDTYFTVLPAPEESAPAEPLLGYQLEQQNIQIEMQSAVIEELKQQVETLSEEVLK